MRSGDRHGAPGGDRAHITAPGGVLILPAASAYEWQLLCEHVTAEARRHARVSVRLGGVACVVRAATGGSASCCCRDCARPLRRVAFRIAWRDLCGECARRQLIRETDGTGAVCGTPHPATGIVGHR